MIPAALPDADLGARLLDGLDATRIPYVVLHGEGQLASGVLGSDVDLAVGIPIADVVASLRRAAKEAGAGLIMVSPYDEGGLATFWLRRDWSGGVQIDLLRDPRGRSKLAFKTDVALRHVIRGKRWLKLTAPAEQAYLLSKRWLKGDVEALRLLRAEASSPEAPLLEVLTVRRAGVVARQTAPRTSVRPVLPLLRSRVSLRGLRRMRYPIGLLIGVAGDGEVAGQLADLVCDRLGPVVVKVERTFGSSRAAGLRRSLVLRRPQVLVAVGHIGRRPDIEVEVAEGDDPSQFLDRLWAELVSLTELRLEAQLRVHRFHS